MHAPSMLSIKFTSCTCVGRRSIENSTGGIYLIILKCYSNKKTNARWCSYCYRVRHTGIHVSIVSHPFDTWLQEHTPFDAIRIVVAAKCFSIAVYHANDLNEMTTLYSIDYNMTHTFASSFTQTISRVFLARIL